jgi:hypothetical protein
MRTKIRQTFAAVALALLACVTLVSPASAAADGFTAQARAAGLTAEQAATLQAKVDVYLKEVGGTQVSPNRIDLANGGVVKVALPGEKQPRQFAAVPNAAPDPRCDGGADYLYFCAYSYIDYTGDQLAMGSCAYYEIRWIGTGSWDNNQTPGTQPTAYFTDGRDPWGMPPARSTQARGVNWWPVAGIRNC